MINNINKKTGYVIALVLVVIIVALAVSKNGSPESTGVVKIGLLSPLTGNFAPLGADFSAGARVAGMDYSNIKILEADTGSDPKTAISAMNKLMQEGVSIFLTGPGSPVSLALVPIAQERHVILIAQTKTPKVDDSGEYVFRFSPLVNPEATAMAEYVYSSGMRKAAVIYDSSSDTLTLGQEAFTERFRALGGEIASVEGFDPKSVQDFRTIILKIKASHPDAFYLAVNENQTVPIIKQSRTLGLSAPLFGWVTQDTDRVTSNAGSDIEGMVITAEPLVCDLNETTKKYCSEYSALASSTPQYYGGYGYDAVKFVSDAVFKSGSDFGSILSYLNSIRNFDGVMGRVEFDDKGNMTNKTFMFKVARNGHFVPL